MKINKSIEKMNKYPDDDMSLPVYYFSMRIIVQFITRVPLQLVWRRPPLRKK